MTTFNDLVSHRRLDLAATRIEGHHALQLVAAAGLTHLGAHPEFHTSVTTWNEDSLVGAELVEGVRVELHLGTLTLVVRHGDRLDRYGLIGRSPADGVAWLRASLRRTGLPDETLTFPAWELPGGGRTMARGPFVAEPELLGVLALWFAASHATLSAVAKRERGASPVRCWPHHFDIATLIELGPELGEKKQARSIGVGMSPGDAAIPQPYLYVNCWPYPDVRSNPPLPDGRWNTQGWYGAVFDAADIDSQAEVDAFVDVAIRHCRAVAGH